MAASRLVVLDGTRCVGVLVRAGGEITFRYDDQWLSTPGATPLSVSMPLGRVEHGHDVVHPWLWGLLPDNDRVLTRWARTFHTTTKHPMGLLAVVGRDVPGRFRLVPEKDAETVTPSGVEWLSDADVEQLLREVRADHTAWLGTRGAAGRWSLAGAQPKIALRLDGLRWGRPYGDSATTHILKPAIQGLDQHDLNEHLCLQAARRVGVLAARTSVVSVGDQRAICVERYDRAIRGDDVVRVHQEDLCQALSVDPTQKYESDNGPSVPAAAALLTRCIGEPAAHTARERFAEALALNWLLAGPDAHAKNYSLLLSQDQVRLAPLYDVASVLPYEDFYAGKFKMAMRIGGQYLAARVTTDHWRKAAAQLALDADWLLARVAILAGQLPDALATAAADESVTALDSALPERLVELVGDRCAALRARIG
ncbi:MAG: type II toxin-antitoxin system HipA family toxin [Mycobacteriales bacterium]